MPADLKNSTTRTFMVGGLIATNTNSIGYDVTGYEGLIDIVVGCAIGTGTTPTIDFYAQSSTTNNISNATNLNVAITQIANTATLATIQVDPRAMTGKWLFGKLIVGGTTPNVASIVHIQGVKQVQP